jgi:hypothetical protein
VDAVATMGVMSSQLLPTHDTAIASWPFRDLDAVSLFKRRVSWRDRLDSVPCLVSLCPYEAHPDLVIMSMQLPYFAHGHLTSQCRIRWPFLTRCRPLCPLSPPVLAQKDALSGSPPGMTVLHPFPRFCSLQTDSSGSSSRLASMLEYSQ